MTRPKSSRDLFIFPLVVCATVLAYFPALRGALLWDDSGHVTRPDLRSLQGLWNIWFHLGATQQYYPLLHTAFWIEHRLWGDAVLGYHLVNVALHALAACLLVQIARRLDLPAAWLAGLLFALHPMCVEAVGWISEQKSVLSGVLYLGAALAYLRFDESRKLRPYWAALGLFLLALLAKTVTATLPAALLVILWWLRGRIDWKTDARPLVPFLALGIAAGLFTAWVERTYIGASGVDFTLTPLDRVLLAGRALWFYAWKIVWPVDLAFFYPRWHIDPSEWWQYLFPLSAVAVAIALWRVSKRHPGPLAAYLIFVVTLFPALGFFDVYPFRYSFVADHFAYLALMVPAVALPAVLPRGFWNKRPWIAAPLAVVLGALTWPQAGNYRDEETLYRATLRRNPDAWLAHNNLGNILLAIPGRRDEALAHFHEALRLNPDFWEAHLSLGNALLQTPGSLDQAIAEYETAARMAPKSERTQTNLGNALLQAGRIAETIPHLEAALRIRSSNPEAHNDLGNAFSQLPGRLSDAVAQYQAAIAADPDFAEAHNNLGRALAQSGRLPDAIAEFQAAIRIRPAYWSAHSNLGNALSQIPDRLPDAILEYQAALRIRPDSSTAHNNLGFAFSRMTGRLPDAIAEYRTALQLDPASADAHYNLGAALLRTPGHQQEALAEFEIVAKLRPNAGMQQMIDRLRH